MFVLLVSRDIIRIFKTRKFTPISAGHSLAAPM